MKTIFRPGSRNCNGGHVRNVDLDANEILQEISDYLPADSDYKGKQFPASNSYNKISGSNTMQGRTAQANLNTKQSRRDCDNGFRACLEKVGLRETWPRLLAIKYLSIRKCGASGFDFEPAGESSAEVEDEEESD